MPTPDASFRRYIQTLLAAGQGARALRLRLYWEPKVVAELAAAASEGMALLRQALAEYPHLPAGHDNPDALRVWLGSALAALARDKVARAGQVLLDMARQETRTSAEIATLNGLLGPMPELEGLAPGLAGEPALRQAAARAQGDFIQGVDQLLAKALAQPQDPAWLDQELGRLAQAFGQRQRTIAVTLTHAVANRLTLAVGRALA